METTEKNATELFAQPEEDDLSGSAHRQLIGYLGLILPVFLWLMAGLRPTDGLPAWELLSSISAYFYTGALPAFAGGLVALGVFFFTYRGYDNAYGYRDRIAAIIAGMAALLVAFFPAAAPKTIPAPSWWTPWMGWIHYASAVILFSSFVFFSVFQFTKSNPEEVTPGKQRRNWFYVFGGAAIVACLVWVVIASFLGASIFWPEALALEFFAVTWLVKGRVDVTAVGVAQRVKNLMNGERYAGD